MSAVFYLCKELFFSIKSPGIKASVTAVGLLGLCLVVLTALLTAWDLLGLRNEIHVYALFSEAPTEQIVHSWYDQIILWPEVAGIRYPCRLGESCPLPGEFRRAWPRSPESAPGYYQITVRRPEDLASLEEKLKTRFGLDVLTYERASLRQTLARSALAQNIAVLVLSLSLGLALLGLVYAFRTMEKLWASELETLSLAGVSVLTLRAPFFLLGILVGLAAALLALVIFYLLQLAAVHTDVLVRPWLPDVLQENFLAQLTWRLLGLGFLLGVLLGGFTAVSVRLKF